MFHRWRRDRAKTWGSGYAVAGERLGCCAAAPARRMLRQRLNDEVMDDAIAYLASGLMALCRRAGNRVVCVTATRGEHGTDDAGRWPPDRLARTRDLEVAAAMAIIGVDEHRCLGMEDGTLAHRPDAAGVDAVTALIHEVAPNTIVTFGPEGMTGHADHRAVAAWVARAWRRAGQRALLLQTTTTDRFATEYADVHDALPLFGPGLPARTGEEDLAVTVRLDEELQDVKLAALRAQATQTQGLVAAIGEDRFRAWGSEETFMTPGVASQLPPISTCSPRRLQGRAGAFRQSR